VTDLGRYWIHGIILSRNLPSVLSRAIVRLEREDGDLFVFNTGMMIADFHVAGKEAL